MSMYQKRLSHWSGQMTQGQLLFSLDKHFGNKPFLERATLEKKHNVDIIKTSLQSEVLLHRSSLKL